MTTTALYAALRADLLSQEESDFSRLTQLLEEAERREKRDGNLIDVTAARARFDREYSALSAPLYAASPAENPPFDRKRRGKRKNIRWMMLAAILLVLVILPAAGQGTFLHPQDSWQTEESAQILGHSMGVQATGEGMLSIRFAISGKGEVAALGAEELVIWHLENGTWLETFRYDRNSPTLCAVEKQDYGRELCYQGWPGEVYRIRISVFVENEIGYDSRSQEFQVTAA